MAITRSPSMMLSAAFISTAAPALSSSTFASPRLSTRAARQSSKPHRRARFIAAADKPPATETKENSSYEAPSFDTEVFSKFVDSAQAKVDEVQQQFQEIDTDELLADTKEASVRLVDNALAGDWLNRGELYGAIQLVFALLLLRAPGALDGLVSFMFGPVVFAVGASISTKALWDLGRKQLSIWPAPVPDGELKTQGMYEYVRHPMYAGVLLASAGFSVFSASPARLALTFAFGAFLAKKVEVEEEFLVDQYPGYEGYCEKVSEKFLPGIF